MLFANTCHKAYVHAQATQDFRSAARLMRAVGATLDEALMLLLGIHQRQRRRRERKHEQNALGAAPALLRSLD